MSVCLGGGAEKDGGVTSTKLPLRSSSVSITQGIITIEKT
jgi:hypothetical protein